MYNSHELPSESKLQPSELFSLGLPEVTINDPKPPSDPRLANLTARERLLAEYVLKNCSKPTLKSLFGLSDFDIILFGKITILVPDKESTKLKTIPSTLFTQLIHNPRRARIFYQFLQQNPQHREKITAEMLCTSIEENGQRLSIENFEYPLNCLAASFSNSTGFRILKLFIDNDPAFVNSINMQVFYYVGRSTFHHLLHQAGVEFLDNLFDNHPLLIESPLCEHIVGNSIPTLLAYAPEGIDFLIKIVLKNSIFKDALYELIAGEDDVSEELLLDLDNPQGQHLLFLLGLSPSGQRLEETVSFRQPLESNLAEEEMKTTSPELPLVLEVPPVLYDPNGGTDALNMQINSAKHLHRFSQFAQPAQRPLSDLPSESQYKPQ